jgi:23S rRNA (guanosine2251-2'-O)-methyltransferase
MHLEGRMSVKAALDVGRRAIEKILVAEGADEARFADVLAAAMAKKLPITHVSAAALDEIAHGKTHGGLVAMCGVRAADAESALEPALKAKEPALFLLLEGVDDARNFGSTLRTAESLGVHAVLVRKREWDLDETDVMRASSGAFERLVIVRFDHEDGLVGRLKARGLGVWACVPNVMGTIYDADLAKPAVIAIGGEKRGLSGTLRAQCTGFMRIPMRAGSSSLAGRDAAAIVIAEVGRQRPASRARFAATDDPISD